MGGISHQQPAIAGARVVDLAKRRAAPLNRRLQRMIGSRGGR
jgi:hypothetical protein